MHQGAPKEAILLPLGGDLDLADGLLENGVRIPEVAPTGPIDATDFTFWVKTETLLPSPCGEAGPSLELPV
jgi:hypothetical protein